MPSSSKGVKAQARGDLKHRTASLIRHVACPDRLPALCSVLCWQADKLIVKETRLTCSGTHHQNLFMESTYGCMCLQETLPE